MAYNPLLEKIQNNETSIGLWINSPDMVELCAHLGFDWFSIDQMFTGMDWGKTEEMIRTGEAAGITPIVRVQSNPWLGYDHRIAIDVTRAAGIGAQFIHVSYSSTKEIEECLQASSDWHRKAIWIHPYNSEEEWTLKKNDPKKTTYIIPCIESKGIESIEETLSLPGLKMFFFAMTDLSLTMTNSNKPDWYHPKIWEYLKRAVEIGEKKGIMIGANTSYAYDMKEMQKRVRMLHDIGVKMIMVQGANFLFQIAIGKFLRAVKKDLGLSGS
ncbi:MAG: hypothetical protein KKH97_07710 [Proteobacteria bacterium]|nr:hypothetical protein [Pseudomonadota bacterium]